MIKIRELDADSYAEFERFLGRSFVAREDFVNFLRGEYETVIADFRNFLVRKGVSESSIDVGDVWNVNRVIGLGVYDDGYSLDILLPILEGFSVDYPEWAMTIFWDFDEEELEGILYKGEFMMIKKSLAEKSR